MTERELRESSRLYDEGLDALADERLEDALEIAGQLEERCFSGAFELRALVLDRQGEKESAIDTLREGLELAPDVWSMWQLVGKVSSDVGRFDEARVSYERALACPHVHRDSVGLNQAVLAARCGDYPASMILLETIGDPDLWAQVTAIHLSNLLDLGQLAECRALGETFLARIDRGDEGHDPSIGRAFKTLALGTKRLGHSVAETEQLVLRGLAADFESEDLLWALREVRGVYSEDARAWGLTLQGRDETEGTAGFIIVHRVVADSAYEALELARELQGIPGFDMLDLEEYEDEGPRPEDPKGVYDNPVRHYYESED